MKRPLDVQTALGQAFTAYETGKLSQARSLARDVAAARPQLGGAHYLLGLVALRQGQAKPAIEAFRKAASLDPTAPPPAIGLARALAAAGLIAEALTAYDHALRLSPGQPALLAERAGLLRRTGELDGAEQGWRAALAADPALAEAHNDLGSLLRDLGRPAEAVSHLTKATELAPQSATAWNNLGIALADLGRLEAAADALGRAVAFDHRKARVNLAGVERRRRNAQAAFDLAAAARRLDRRDGDAALMLGLAAKDLGRLDEAERVLRDAVKGGSAEAGFALGEVLAATGKADEAARCFEDYLAKDPADRLGAALQLARLGRSAPPDRAPDAFVAKLFDDYAESFDAALVGKLRYSAPELLRDELAALAGQGLRILDAGCGTGLAGVALKTLAARLTGVDLSPRMIDKARERGLYDDLAVADLVGFLESRAGAFDAVVAADVFVYIGNLAPSIAAAHRALGAQGWLAFTVERHDGEGFVLRDSNRYAHSERHLRDLAAEHGFECRVLRDVSTREDAGQPVPGYLCVWRKG